MAEPINLPFGLWTRVCRRKHKFNHIRQVAPMCPHGRAHWRHLANTTELVLPLAHPSPPSKRWIDQPFLHSSRQKVPILYSGRHFPQKLPLPRGIWTHPGPQTKRHLYWFSHFCTDGRRVFLYFTMGRPFPPSKLPLPMGDVDSHLTHGSLGPPDSSTQMAPWSVQLFLQGSLVWQIDQQTDRQTTLFGQ